MNLAWRDSVESGVNWQVLTSFFPLLQVRGIGGRVMKFKTKEQRYDCESQTERYLFQRKVNSPWPPDFIVLATG